MKSTPITTPAELQPNSVYIFQLNPNSLKLNFTNSDNELHEITGRKFKVHQESITAWKLETHETATQIEIYSTFWNLCSYYISASDNLKKFIEIAENSPVQMFENTQWYRFAAKRSKHETIEKNRAAWETERKNEHEKELNRLIEAKQKAKQIFDDMGIPVKVAYAVVAI